MELVVVIVVATLAGLAVDFLSGYIEAKKAPNEHPLFSMLMTSAIVVPLGVISLTVAPYKYHHPREEVNALTLCLVVGVAILGEIACAVGAALGRKKVRNEEQTNQEPESPELPHGIEQTDQRPTLERIAEIILKYIDVPEGITEDMLVQPLYETYGIEVSAGMFALELELEFELEDDIPDDVAQSWQTIGEVVRYIVDHKVKEEESR